MMNNMDRFSPGAWQENGLLKASTVTKMQPKMKPRRVAPLVAVVAVSVSFVSVTVEGTQTIMGGTGPATHIATQHLALTAGSSRDMRFAGDYISPRSWPRLIAAIENLPDIKEAEGSDPEPFI